MNQRLGKQTVTFGEPATILETAAIVGQKEGEGPIAQSKFAVGCFCLRYGFF